MTTQEEIERRRRDWAEQAEVDFADIVPRPFFPWWANVPFCAMVAAGLHYLSPVPLSAAAAAAAGTVLAAWGMQVRRGSKPSVARFWAAVIAAIAAFLALLILFIDRDSPLMVAWASCSSAGIVYLVVMTARRGAFTASTAGS